MFYDPLRICHEYALTNLLFVTDTNTPGTALRLFSLTWIRTMKTKTYIIINTDVNLLSVNDPKTVGRSDPSPCNRRINLYKERKPGNGFGF